MPTWKKTDRLTADQTGHPVEVLGRLEVLRPEAVPTLPRIDGSWCVGFWGGPETSHRFRTWGHRDGKLSAHFIVTRGGLAFHTDPGFARYSVHLQIFNGGWVTHGLQDKLEELPVYERGLVTLIDTGSPHAVSRDPRLPMLSASKVAAAIDFVQRPTATQKMEALDAICEHLPNIFELMPVHG